MTLAEKEELMNLIAWVHDERLCANDMAQLREYGVDPHGLRKLHKAVEKIRVRKVGDK
jgi:hypothetical protein